LEYMEYHHDIQCHVLNMQYVWNNQATILK
jgi:hypothetical protein